MEKTPLLKKTKKKPGPEDFTVIGLIGKGSFGEVYLVEKVENKKWYAMKHNLIKYAISERNTLSSSTHPFIVRLRYAFQTEDLLYLILDFCPGGDLSEHLQKEKKFKEDRVKIYIAEILLALEDLHKKDIIYRDLKPDNIVLDSTGHALLTDFGLSKEGVNDHIKGAKSFCGSVAYLAPEMLSRCGHGKAVDWYLLGVLMYELLTGRPPYFANSKEEIYYNIQYGQLKIPDNLTEDAKSLLKSLLQKNPYKRLGSGKADAEEIKCHPFFKEIDWNDVLKRKLKPPLPYRKLKICTKFNLGALKKDSFMSIESESEKYISNWSFVNANNTFVE